MIVLGIDSSDNLCTAAVSDSYQILGEISFRIDRSQLQSLVPTIQRLLEDTGLNKSDIDLFVIVRGPGNWSGIRIGVATVKSMAYALKKPVVGINALDAYAQNYRYTNIPVYPVIDAHKSEVYYAVYDCSGDTPERKSGIARKKIDQLIAELNTESAPALFTGSGLIKYPGKILPPGNGENGNLIVSPPSVNQLSGRMIIEAGIKTFERFGAVDTFDLAPLYLQDSGAEKNYQLKQKTEGNKC